MAMLNLDELHRFRVRLDEIVDRMGQDRRLLDAAVDEAKNYWRDVKYLELSAQISPRLAALQRFEARAKEYVEWMTVREQLGRDILE